MIEGRVIVCLASSWDYDPTSKHQIMRILSRHNDIVWINYHGTRKPGITGSDTRAMWSALKRVARGTRRVSDSIVQTTPLVIPGATNGILCRIHQRMLIAQIKRAIRAVDPGGARPLQVWTFAPDVPYLVGRFGEECFVYYCVDEYSQFEDFDARAVLAAENELIDRADLVVTTSQALWETKRKRRGDAVLVRHGVDYDHFAKAWRDAPPPPADVRHISQPVFGFFGLIHHWIDVPLIAEVARRRPQYAFVLIGDCKVDVGCLESLPNVHRLGRRAYEGLPSYCAAFAAGLLPFKQSAMTRNINPIKMYEYLAAGLPVVSTPLPEAERFGHPIAIADTPEKFAAACDRIVEAEHPETRQAISSLVADRSWQATVDHLCDLVMNIQLLN